MDPLHFGFHDELIKIARRKKRDEGRLHAVGTPAAAILGQTAIGIGALGTGMIRDGNPKDDKAKAKIEAYIKKKGVGRGEYPSPAYIPKTKNKKLIERYERAGLKPNTVVGPKRMSLDALAHEAGHASGMKGLQRGPYGISRALMLPALLGTAGAIAHGTGSKGKLSKEEREKRLKTGRNIAGVGAATSLPMLAEEGRATFRGGRMVARHSGLKRLPKYLGRTGLAFGTYAAIPGASAYAAKKMHNRLKNLEEQGKKPASKKVLRRRAG